MTKQETGQILAILKASYPRQQITRENFEAYASMLADLDFEDAKAACQRIVCSSKWFPTIAEIRSEVAEEATAALPAPELAWGEVWKAISKYGMGRPPVFSCPEIAAAVDAIGWRSICHDENVMSTRSRFTDAYRAIHQREVRSAQLGPHDVNPTRLPERRGFQRALFAVPKVAP